MQIASKIGLSWPLAQDAVIFEGASLLYVPQPLTLGDGTKLTADLTVTASISIPSAGINHLQGALVIAGSRSLTIKVRITLFAAASASAISAQCVTSWLCISTRAQSVWCRRCCHPCTLASAVADSAGH